MSVCLVTGAIGFLGCHLIAALKTRPTHFGRIVETGRTLPHANESREFVPADLTKTESIRCLLEAVSPDVIFHLAGKTPPGSAEDFYRANTLATALLFDVLRERGRPVRVVQVGSAAELGVVPDCDLPVGEDYPCRPTSAYGLSKWLCTQAGVVSQFPIEVIAARVFNPVGPGIPEAQAIGSFATRLADPGISVLKVGDVTVKRDFVDVRDVARALIALAQQGHAGLVYHVGTGQSQTVQSGLDYFIGRSGRSIETISESIGGLGGRLNDSRADIMRIKEHTGWRPEIPWEQSLSEIWDEAVRRRWLPLTT